jgi:hypothetical protein
MSRISFLKRMLLPRVFAAIVFLFFFLPASGHGQENGMTVGYGLGNLNPRDSFGNIPEGRGYNFLHLSYFHEFKITSNGFFVLEPFFAYTYRTMSGIDLGLNLLYKYRLWNSQSLKNSFYGALGTGGVYTNVDFTDQASHWLFIVQAGVGFKLDRYFIEFRHRHYSNGGLAVPNTGVEAEILSLGFYF